MRDFSLKFVSPTHTHLIQNTMIEFILATVIIVGKTEIGPDTIQYDVLNEDGQIEQVIDTQSNNVWSY